MYGIILIACRVTYLVLHLKIQGLIISIWILYPFGYYSSKVWLLPQVKKGLFMFLIPGAFTDCSIWCAGWRFLWFPLQQSVAGLSVNPFLGEMSMVCVISYIVCTSALAETQLCHYKCYQCQMDQNVLQAGFVLCIYILLLGRAWQWSASSHDTLESPGWHNFLLINFFSWCKISLKEDTMLMLGTKVARNLVVAIQSKNFSHESQDV